MSDLVAFLRARLDEDEATALACGEGTGFQATGLTWIHPDSNYRAGRIEDERGTTVVYDEGAPTVQEANHIARHDPARVLREVEAKRLLLTEVVALIDGMDMQIESEWGTGGTRTTGESDAVLRVLAAVYSDHPDYDQEWRP